MFFIQNLKYGQARDLRSPTTTSISHCLISQVDCKNTCGKIKYTDMEMPTVEQVNQKEDLASDAQMVGLLRDHGGPMRNTDV